MADRESALLSALLLALFACAAAISLAYPPAARRFPLGVALLGAAFCALKLHRDMRGAPGCDLRAAPAGAAALERTPLADELRVLAWFAGFVAAAIAIGVVPGGALLMFAFLRVRGAESWTHAALWSVGSAGAVHLFFERLLGAAFFPGLLTLWLAGSA